MPLSTHTCIDVFQHIITPIHRSALPTFGRHAINFLVPYKIINVIIGTLLCVHTACYFVKSVNCKLSDVVKNSIQKLRTGRKLCAGIKCADQTPYIK